ncbi:MAG: hypothetical protein AVDCRST_MAG09-958, partial [uncultured Sphingomonas sp.]
AFPAPAGKACVRHRRGPWLRRRTPSLWVANAGWRRARPRPPAADSRWPCRSAARARRQPWSSSQDRDCRPPGVDGAARGM